MKRTIKAILCVLFCMLAPIAFMAGCGAVLA